MFGGPEYYRSRYTDRPETFEVDVDVWNWAAAVQELSWSRAVFSQTARLAETGEGAFGSRDRS